MKIRLLTETAYNRIITLQETMSKKDRGYGVIPVKIQNITFAIPFRSNMAHKHGFKTIFHNGVWNGVDYSKAIVITEDDLQPKAFKLRSEAEYQKVKNNKDKIQRQFEKYVNDYVSQAKLGNLPNLQRFGYTTLVNYHCSGIVNLAT